MIVTRRDVVAGLGAATLPLAVWPGLALAEGGGDMRMLRFGQPARKWLEALPVGNGRIGAMVHGGVAEERIALNHIELWSGRPADDDRRATLVALPEVRRLLFAGRYAEANAMAQPRMMAPMNPETYGSYQMLGDPLLAFDHGDAAQDYERVLDMASAEVRVGYTAGGHRDTRQILCSHPGAVLAIRLTTIAPGGMGVSVRLRQAQDAVVTAGGAMLHLRGRPTPHGTTFAADLACTTEGGTVTAVDGGLRVVGARGVTLQLTAATDLLAGDPAGRVRAAMEVASGKSMPTLVAEHRADHRPLFDGIALKLAPSAAVEPPPSQLAQGGDDHALVERYFNLGRSLLIAASRPAALPANLQGLWPDGLAWLGLQFWEHYSFGVDRAFLRDHAYPMLKARAAFTLDYLVAHPATGRLVAGPATSPENRYRLPDGGAGAITMGRAMSQSIAFGLLARCRDAAVALGSETAMAARCEAAITRLQRLRIAVDGRIMEWPEPFAEAEIGHRHVSHLFGLYPGTEIDVETTPALAAAARRTLAARLAGGGGGGQTGWSAAWLTMFRARLGEGDAAWAMLRKLFRESTARNYFDTHPSDQPDPLFQIDGNLGATAAIVEMLMQSHDGRLRILPALPEDWSEGRILGARARGRVAVDIEWRGGLARRVTLRPARHATFAIVPPPRQTLTRIREDGRLRPIAPTYALRAGRAYARSFGTRS